MLSATGTSKSFVGSTSHPWWRKYVRTGSSRPPTIQETWPVTAHPGSQVPPPAFTVYLAYADHMLSAAAAGVILHAMGTGGSHFQMSLLFWSLFPALLLWLFCSPMDWSLPGSSVHGIFQAKILKWAISFSIPTLQKRLFYHDLTSLGWEKWVQRKFLPSYRTILLKTDLMYDIEW